MSESGENKVRDDRILEDYLARKSALSMGYRRVYVEAPPEELDRAITARARRALKWLVPGVLAAAVAFTLVIGINVGIKGLMNSMVGAEQNINARKKLAREAAERARLEAPVSVIIDPKELSTARHEVQTTASQTSSQLTRDHTREQWLARIETLKRRGKLTEANQELKRFQAAYPDKVGDAPK